MTSASAPTTPPSAPATPPSVTVRDAKGRPVFVGRADDATLPAEVLTAGASVTFVGVGSVHPVAAPQGGILLRPLPLTARRNTRIRSIVSFRPRNSRFDRFNAESSADSFRGFYTLFWICMFLAMLNSFWRSYHNTGAILSLGFFNLFSRDAKILALSDAVLISHLFIAVPLIQYAQSHRIRYANGLVCLVHFWLACMLAAVIKWSRRREWPWVQSGFFVLHAIAMMMKLYSYLDVNGHHADDYWLLRDKEAQLAREVERIEGGESDEKETLLDDDSISHSSSINSISESPDRTTRTWRRACVRALHHSEVLDDDFVGWVVKSDWCKQDVQRGTCQERYVAKNAIPWCTPVKPPHNSGEEAAPTEQEVGVRNERKMESVAKDAVGQALSAAGLSVGSDSERDNAAATSGALLGSSSEKESENGREADKEETAGKPGPQSHAHFQDEKLAAPVELRSAVPAHRKDDPTFIRDPHPLATHPNEAISQLASEIEVLRDSLVSRDPYRLLGVFGAPSPTFGAAEDLTQRQAYPNNLTYANFLDYLLVPSLVYELEYPRTGSIRPGYLIEKILATFGTFFCIYIITTSWILPISPRGSEHPWPEVVGIFLQLAIPMMGCYILIFYIIFEAILNFFAEATRFADREFYKDWWNSKSMDEFSRDWNRPVHSFLLKHVYASTIAVGMSKSFAIFFTFLLSSLMHELVMAIVTGKIRGYLFAMQMAQLPLIALGQVKFIKDSPVLGNLIFWIGLMVGFPLLNVLYLSY